MYIVKSKKQISDEDFKIAIDKATKLAEEKHKKSKRKKSKPNPRKFMQYYLFEDEIMMDKALM